MFICVYYFWCCNDNTEEKDILEWKVLKGEIYKYFQNPLVMLSRPYEYDSPTHLSLSCLGTPDGYFINHYFDSY